MRKRFTFRTGGWPVNTLTPHLTILLALAITTDLTLTTLGTRDA